MLIPLRTDRSLRSPTLATYVLIAVNVAVFALMFTLERASPRLATTWLGNLMLHPREVTAWGFVTYAFLHGGPLHLLGNMLMLWVFGPNVEDRFGRWWFVAFYLTAGVVAGGVHCALEYAPVVGASGAIAGVTGAYLVLFPRTQVKCLVWFFIIGIFWLPAWAFIVFAIAKDLVWMAISGQAIVGGLAVHDGVARGAHIGGYAFGALLSMTLLWFKVLGREPYDLFTIGRQAYRRRQLREASLAVERGLKRQGPMATGRTRGRADETEAMSNARADIARQLTSGDPAAAARAYKDFVNRFGNDHRAVTLAVQNQVDVGNQLFAEGDYSSAAYAYERFIEFYPDEREAPRVRLMLGLACARYLNDPVRAKQVLTGLESELDDESQRTVARTLLHELA